MSDNPPPTTAELESWFGTLNECATSDLADLVVIRADDKTKREFLLPLYKASQGIF